MFIIKNFFILILIQFFTCLDKKVLSEIKNEFTIISDSQSQNDQGIFEAKGNVKINGDKNFKASSDRLIYEKNESKLNLIGNVEVKNYEFDGILIKNIESDELILFIDKSGLIINSKKGNRVKTNLKF